MLSDLLQYGLKAGSSKQRNMFDNAAQKVPPRPFQTLSFPPSTSQLQLFPQIFFHPVSKAFLTTPFTSCSPSALKKSLPFLEDSWK